jgi:hypothetical protein
MIEIKIISFDCRTIVICLMNQKVLYLKKRNLQFSIERVLTVIPIFAGINEAVEKRLSFYTHNTQLLPVTTSVTLCPFFDANNISLSRHDKYVNEQIY